MKFLPLVLALASPAVLADTIHIACPPGDNITVHPVTNNGDFDGKDGTNEADLEVFKENFGKHYDLNDPEVVPDKTDLNGDGVTNLKDFALFKMLLDNPH